MAVQQWNPGIEKETGHKVHRETVAGGQYSSWLLVTGTDPVTCAVVPGSGGTAKVQVTYDSPTTVASGSPTAFDWALGAVSAAADGILDGRVTAFRFYAGTAAASCYAQQ